MTYAALASDQIRAAAIRGWRANRAAPTCHAAVFAVVEEMGLGIFDLSRDDVKRMATERARSSVTGIWGMLIGGLISWVVGRLVDVIWAWLVQTLDEWVKRNRAMPAMAEGNVRGAMFASLKPMFDDAREVLNRGQAS